MDRSSLEVLLAQGLSLEEIGRRFGKHPSTVGYWVQKQHGTDAPRPNLPRAETAASETVVIQGYPRKPAEPTQQISPT